MNVGYFSYIYKEEECIVILSVYLTLFVIKYIYIVCNNKFGGSIFPRKFKNMWGVGILISTSSTDYMSFDSVKIDVEMFFFWVF